MSERVLTVTNAEWILVFIAVAFATGMLLAMGPCS